MTAGRVSAEVRSLIRSGSRSACVLLCTAFLSQVAAAPTPGWLVPELPRRAAFTAPQRARGWVAVRAPVPAGTSSANAVAAYDLQGNRVPVMLIHSGPREVSCLVNYGAQPRRALLLYYGAASSNPALKSAAALKDPLPVALSIYPLRGSSVPNSWEKMLVLYQRARRPQKETLLAGFKAGSEVGSLHDRTAAVPGKPPKRPPRAIVRLQTMLYCPQPGVYRFALQCEDAGFLLVDGEMANSRPGIHPPGGARLGPPLVLQAGLHRVSILNACRKQMAINLLWLPPGREAAQGPLPVPPHRLVTARMADRVRVESIDKTLHPAFRYIEQPSYTFRGSGMRFTPVELKDESRNWIGENIVHTWVGGSGRTYSGRAVKHVFEGMGPHRMRLDVRDTLGFVASTERTIDLNVSVPHEYAIAASMDRLPAATFVGDTVAPHLRVSGKLPARVDLAAEIDIRMRDGAAQSIRRDVALGGIEDVRIPVIRARAGDIEQIRWRVEHAGIPVYASTIRFMRPPFDAVPSRLDEDRIYDARGTRLVLVAAQFYDEYQQQPITTAQAFGTLTCVDDALAAPGRRDRGAAEPFEQILAKIVDGPDRPIVRYRALPDWRDAQHGYGPLLKLVQVPDALGRDVNVAVLCLGLQDVLTGTPVSRFERHAAALTDIIVTGMQKPVVWTTPPPVGDDPAIIRPYAAAIRRVADARGVPVADLYSAFRGVTRNDSLVTHDQHLSLTDQGHQLTARVIARALLSE